MAATQKRSSKQAAVKKVAADTESALTPNAAVQQTATSGAVGAQQMLGGGPSVFSGRTAAATLREACRAGRLWDRQKAMGDAFVSITESP